MLTERSGTSGPAAGGHAVPGPRKSRLSPQGGQEAQPGGGGLELCRQEECGEERLEGSAGGPGSAGWDWAGVGGQWCRTEESGVIALPSPTAPEQDPTFLGLPHASGGCFHGP